MKLKKTACVLLPSLIMWLILFILNTNIFNLGDLDLKGLFIASLIVIFPLLFLTQGAATVITNNNPFLAFLVSILGYSVVIFSNVSTLCYIFYFALFYIIGYIVVKFFVKKNNSALNI